MYNDKSFVLIRELLLNRVCCPPKDLMPPKERDWHLFFGILINNRLTGLLSHFYECEQCKKFLANKIKEKIKESYLYLFYMHYQYEKLKDDLGEIFKKYKLKIILLKDNYHDGLENYYPKNFYPLKYDIDLWGRKKDLDKLSKVINEWGYLGQQQKLENRYLIDQFEFKQEAKRSSIEIEYRYQILTCERYKQLPIITNDLRARITAETFRYVVFSENKFGRLTAEWTFIVRYLIFYFDDACQGMKHLFDLWLFATKEKINWSYIFSVLERFKLINNFIFTVKLALTVFGEPKDYIPQAVSKPPFSAKLSLLLFRNYSSLYIPFSPSANIFYKRSAWKGRYLFMLITGILWQTSLTKKLLFFLRPKTLFSIVLFTILTTLNLLKGWLYEQFSSSKRITI